MHSPRCTSGAFSGYSGRYEPAGVPRCAGRGLECGTEKMVLLSMVLSIGTPSLASLALVDGRGLAGLQDSITPRFQGLEPLRPVFRLQGNYETREKTRKGRGWFQARCRMLDPRYWMLDPGDVRVERLVPSRCRAREGRAGNRDPRVVIVIVLVIVIDLRPGPITIMITIMIMRRREGRLVVWDRPGSPGSGLPSFLPFPTPSAPSTTDPRARSMFSF